ncbi:hypothetical protein [Nostoc sp.]
MNISSQTTLEPVSSTYEEIPFCWFGRLCISPHTIMATIAS